MDYNGNHSKDEPGPSKTPNQENQDNRDEMEAGPSNSRKRNEPYGGPQMRVDDSDDESDDGFETGDNTAPPSHCEKRRRLNSYQDTDSDSIFSISSDSEPIYVVPRYVSPNSPNYPNIYISEPAPYDRMQYVSGYFLLITNIIGGWNKHQVKHFFFKNLGVRFYKSKPFPGVCLGPNDFRLMLQFTCKEAREFVINFIKKRYFEYLFYYISIDQIPSDSLEPESDDEGNAGASCVV